MKSLINRLNVQTLVLDIDKPLIQPLKLDGYSHRFIDETTVEVKLHRGQTINQLFQLLSSQHIYISSMRNKTNRLEELFIHLITKNKKNT